MIRFFCVLATIAFVLIWGYTCYHLDQNKPPLTNWSVSGTNLVFNDNSQYYRCIAGITYIIGSSRTPPVVLVDENNKPRTCKETNN